MRDHRLTRLPLLALPFLVALGAGTARAQGAAGLARSVVSPAQPAHTPLDRVIAVDIPNLPLDSALNTLGRVGDVSIAYDAGEVRSTGARVALRDSAITLGRALDHALAGTGLAARLVAPSVVAVTRSRAAARPRRQTGTITGRVVHAETAVPLPNVQIAVTDTHVQTLTDQDGQFVIRNVATGQHEVTVKLIGYRSVSRIVDVPADGTTRLEVALEETGPIALDEVVVTGRAMGTARREVGTSIATIKSEDLELAPVTSVSQVLQSRIPGMAVLPSGGNAGQGSEIVMRGAVSLSQSIEPIIYVDGVRLDNTKETDVSADATWTGLDDIDPSDIDHIEVVRGAAAATLYGTEASAGVIQIFTKQGQGTSQKWSLSSELGLNQTPEQWWNVSIYSPWFYKNFVRTGHDYNHHLSLSGASNGFSYLLSGTLRGNEGVLIESDEDAKSFRANMRFAPTDKLSVNVNNGYYWRKVSFPEEGNNGANFAYNGLRGGERGILHAPLAIANVRERIANMGRYTASVQVAFTPVEAFSNRLTVGTEVANWDNWRYDEFGDEFDSNGEMYNHRREGLTLNLDYTAQLQFQLTHGIRSSTAFGFQAYSKTDARTRATTTDFVGPGVRSVHAGGSTTGFESRVKAVSAGYFGEQQFGFNNIFFLTFGLRADGHSAFGESLGYQLYPKVDASYMISDQGFWPRRFGTLRLRSAYGTAGRQPSAYASEQTWESVKAFAGEPAFTTGNLGNPDLAPEVSHEFEAGLDYGIGRGGRFAVEYTYYNQRTEHALFNKRYPPSQGFVQTQLANVGELRNEGHEVGVTAHLLQRKAFDWTARVNFSANANKVISLGGSAPLNVAWSQWIQAGYPVGAFFDNRYVMKDGQAVLVSNDYIGQPFPKRLLTLGSDFRIGRNFSVHVLADYKGGHYVSSSTMRWLMSDKVAQGEPFYDPTDPSTDRFEPGSPVALACLTITDPVTDKMCNEDWSTHRGNYIFPADNWHLREVGVGYRLPARVLRRIGATSGMLTVSGRNLWRDQKYPGLDAEANYETSNLLGKQSYFDTPNPRQFLAKINLTY
jgi:outer membrane cobalamin receptor